MPKFVETKKRNAERLENKPKLAPKLVVIS